MANICLIKFLDAVDVDLVPRLSFGNRNLISIIVKMLNLGEKNPMALCTGHRLLKRGIYQVTKKVRRYGHTVFLYILTTVLKYV